MPCFLELQIQIFLNGFPDSITIGTNDHGVATRTVIGELGVSYGVQQVLSVEVLRSWSDDCLLPLQLFDLSWILWAASGDECHGGGGVVEGKEKSSAHGSKKQRRIGHDVVSSCFMEA
ncbi:hypothetical protein PIB30_021883 [Stylosanthes scabra]|uniref:Uncharacterized protein n=1 Tax=Stylosanthes scabra TaxID=79078 RepID=A0ABU6R9A7_9FABA|nr:hypothetical protein [Stylosanthes scabra]